MRRPFIAGLLTAAAILLAPIAHAQQLRVAHFAAGTRGTKSYQRLTFRVIDAKRDRITFAAGAAEEEQPMAWLGPTRCATNDCFRIQFPTGQILSITPRGVTLRVRGGTVPTVRAYHWEYEGPINGIGTSCDACAESAADAVRIVRSHFLH